MFFIITSVLPEIFKAVQTEQTLTVNESKCYTTKIVKMTLLQCKAAAGMTVL